ncbi:MAG: hypothetical protein J4G01_02295 [Dehalococcoidia bacterium]|nr:hypothetical protein [Dehalococcoidia bacterium]
MADFPWVQDELTEVESDVIHLVRLIMDIVPEAGQLMAELPCLSDDISAQEGRMLRNILGAAESDRDLAQEILSLPWVLDDVTDEKIRIVSYLSSMARKDVELSRGIVALPWLRDFVTQPKGELVHHLSIIAETDPTVSRAIVEFPWIQDAWSDTTKQRALRSLLSSGTTDLDIARTILQQIQDMPGNEQLVRLIVLGTTSASESLNPLFNDLLESFVLQHAVVSLPLAGEVNLWAIRPEPFPEDEPVLDMMEHAVTTLEEFTQVPFPTTDVIMVTPLAGPYAHHGIPGAGHYGRFIIVPRHAHRGFDRGAVYHEIAHFVFAGEMPPWLKEGGAEFMFLYANDLAGWERLEQRYYEWEESVWVTCMRHGIFTVQDLNKRLAEGNYEQGICNYTLGAYFLLRLWDVMGTEVLGPALGQVYVFWDLVQRVVTEEEVLEVLLDNIPPELHEAFFEIYHELHTPPSE